jgi:hypothetical protein
VGEPAGDGVALSPGFGVPVVVGSAVVGTAVGVGLETTVASGGAPVSDCWAEGFPPGCGVE